MSLGFSARWHFAFSQATQQAANFFHKNFLSVPEVNTLQFIINRNEQEGGGEKVNMSDRRRQILEVLLLRRHDTHDNLAQEFNVSKMTIRRDIAALTCSYPIETVRGRYCGGVKVKDGYYPYKSSLNTTQI